MSGPVTFKVRNVKKVDKYLERLLEVIKMGSLDRYGKMGVDALSRATPIDTGLASTSWSYEIVRSKDKVSIVWKNSDIEGGYNVALLLQYGHGKRGGGYLQGIDYINPALKPIFEQMAEELWEEVKQ